VLGGGGREQVRQPQEEAVHVRENVAQNDADRNPCADIHDPRHDLL
jgi:hypothetical protein